MNTWKNKMEPLIIVVNINVTCKKCSSTFFSCNTWTKGQVQVKCAIFLVIIVNLLWMWMYLCTRCGVGCVRVCVYGKRVLVKMCRGRVKKIGYVYGSFLMYSCPKGFKKWCIYIRTMQCNDFYNTRHTVPGLWFERVVVIVSAWPSMTYPFKYDLNFGSNRHCLRQQRH